MQTVIQEGRILAEDDHIARRSSIDRKGAMLAVSRGLLPPKLHKHQTKESKG